MLYMTMDDANKVHTDNDCLFCKLIDKNKRITTTFYEDDSCYILEDLHKYTRMHVLSIPKVHVQFIKDLTPAMLYHLISEGDLVCKQLGFTQYYMYINNGPLSGQVIPHVHVHFVA